MDNTPNVVPSPDVNPSEMKPMSEQGQEAPPQEQVPDTTQEETPQTADVVAEQTEAPEGKPEEKAEESKEFEMPDKFKGKSAEEIAKSYTDLETHNKKVEMEKADVDKFIQEAYATPEKVPAPQTPVQTKEGEEAPPMTQEQALEQVAEKLRPMLTKDVNNMMTPTLVEMELRNMVDKYGDSFKAVSSKVAARKKENPSLSLDDAYKLETYNTIGRISEIKGIKQASQTAEEKVKAQVESSRPSGLKPVGVEEAVKDRSVPIEEITEALGPEYSKFAEITKRKKKQI